MKKVLRYIFRFLLVLIFVGGLYYLFASVNKWYSLLPLKGSLSSEVAAFSQQIGQYQIDWKDAQLSIRDTKAKGQPFVFQTVAGEPFLLAAIGNEAIKETRGSFHISDAKSDYFQVQEISSFKTLGQTLQLEGFLGEAKQIPYSISIYEALPGQLALKAEVESDQVNRIYLNYSSDAEETFMGFGEQFSYFNLKGQRVPIFISEQGIGRGDQPTTFLVDAVAASGGHNFSSYACVPHYITNKNRSLFLENTEYSVFDLREDKSVQIELWSNTLTARFFAEDSPLELIENYTRYAGRMKALPDWMGKGAIVGMQGGTDKVRDVWNKMQEAEVPLAGFWLQDWVGQRTTSFGKQLWWNWELDRDHYHGWEQLKNDFEAAEIEVMLYINCFLADVSEKQNAQKNYFKEADELGYLLSDEHGKSIAIQNTSFAAGMIDLSNPKAVRWIKGIIQKEMLEIGAAGWMADFGEALPVEAQLYDGTPALSAHNEYPTEWAQVNAEAVQEWNDSIDIPFFCRAGFTQSPGAARLFWLGDQNVNWSEHDGIKSAVTGMLSGGISGYSINHSDIGGYTTLDNFPLVIQRSEELLLRWMELNALSPVFRSHEGNRPAMNAQAYDNPKVLAHFAKMARLFAALADYRKALMKEAEEKGWPMVRHMLLHYPNEAQFQEIKYEQFLLGDKILMAPVLDPGQETQKVLLPKGEWVHLWSQKLYNCAEIKEIEIAAPIGEPAIFVHPELQALVKQL